MCIRCNVYNLFSTLCQTRGENLRDLASYSRGKIKISQKHSKTKNKMENYKSGIDNMNYLPKSCGRGMVSIDYNFGEYRQKYIGNTSAESLYNSLINFLPKGNHIGNYGK